MFEEKLNAKFRNTIEEKNPQIWCRATSESHPLIQRFPTFFHLRTPNKTIFINCTPGLASSLEAIIKKHKLK